MDETVPRSRVFARTPGGATITHDSSKLPEIMNEQLLQEMSDYLRSKGASSTALVPIPGSPGNQISSSRLSHLAATPTPLRSVGRGLAWHGLKVTPKTGPVLHTGKISDNFLRQSTFFVKTMTEGQRHQLVLWVSKYRNSAKHGLKFTVWVKLLLMDVTAKTKEEDSPYPLRLAICLWILHKAVEYCDLDTAVLMEVLAAVYVGGIGTVDKTALDSEVPPVYLERQPYFAEVNKGKILIDKLTTDLKKARSTIGGLERRLLCDVAPWKRLCLLNHFHAWRQLFTEKAVMQTTNLLKQKYLTNKKATIFRAWRAYAHGVGIAKMIREHNNLVQAEKKKHKENLMATCVEYEKKISQMQDALEKLQELKGNAAASQSSAEEELDQIKAKVKDLERRNSVLLERFNEADKLNIELKKELAERSRESTEARDALSKLVKAAAGERNRIGVRASDIWAAAVAGDVQKALGGSLNSRDDALMASAFVVESAVFERVLLVWANQLLHSGKGALCNNLTLDWNDGTRYLSICSELYPAKKAELRAMADDPNLLSRVERLFAFLEARDITIPGPAGIVGTEDGPKLSKLHGVSAHSVLSGHEISNIRLLIILMQEYERSYAPSFAPTLPGNATYDDILIAEVTTAEAAHTSRKSWGLLLEVLHAWEATVVRASGVGVGSSPDASLRPFMIPDADAAIQDVIQAYAAPLRDIFRAYVTPSATDLQCSDWVRMLTDAQSAIEKKLYLKPRLDSIYSHAVGEISRSMPPRQFTEALVLLCSEKPTEIASRLTTLITQHMLLRCQFNQSHSVREMCSAPAALGAVLTVQKPLSALFAHITFTGGVDFGEWSKFLKDLDLFDSGFGRSDAAVVFAAVRDQSDARVFPIELNRKEFFTSLVLVSLYKVPSPFMPVQARFLLWYHERFLPSIKRRQPQVYAKMEKL